MASVDLQLIVKFKSRVLTLNWLPFGFTFNLQTAEVPLQHQPLECVSSNLISDDYSGVLLGLVPVFRRGAAWGILSHHHRPESKCLAT